MHSLYLRGFPGQGMLNDSGIVKNGRYILEPLEKKANTIVEYYHYYWKSYMKYMKYIKYKK